MREHQSRQNGLDDPLEEDRCDRHRPKDREREIAAIRARLACLDVEKAELEASLTRLTAVQELKDNPPPIRIRALLSRMRRALGEGRVVRFPPSC
jgi:predicted nuclease with TOPRIM domain